MAYPNFKNGPKNGLGPLGVKLTVDLESILPYVKALRSRSNGHKQETLTILAHLLSFISSLYKYGL
jgi:hypothetical protein